MRNITIVLSTLLLTACIGTPPVQDPKPILHPPWPSAYQVCPVTWKLYEVDNQPIVALSYNDNVTLASCVKDMERLLNQYKQMICSYRKELDEEHCALYNKKEQNEQ